MSRVHRCSTYTLHKVPKLPLPSAMSVLYPAKELYVYETEDLKICVKYQKSSLFPNGLTNDGLEALTDAAFSVANDSNATGLKPDEQIQVDVFLL